MLPTTPSHRILIVTDAWLPQVNGVVRTLTTVVAELRAMGHIVEVIGPDRFRTIPCPTYGDIPLSLLPRLSLARMIEAFQPEALHIATEVENMSRPAPSGPPNKRCRSQPSGSNLTLGAPAGQRR